MPIFIVGFARSGTTLCQKVISQRLGIPTLPETHFFEFLQEHEPAGGQLRPDSARALAQALTRFLKVDLDALRPLLGRAEVPIRALFLHLVGQQIGSQPLADKGQWIEKTPGHAEHLERIHQMFPKARFLCMVRDPVHAFASRRELQISGKGWGEEWKPIEAFCAQWSDHVQTVREFGERHPGQLMTMRLEDLVGDPERQLERVREFVGPGFATPIDAPLHPEIVQPFETWKRDALKPVDAAIADRKGKGLLDPYETWRVKTLLREDMSMMGYATDAVEPVGLDDLHHRLITSLDWYRAQFARRDELMDVKTARIRGLLNELADRQPADAPPTSRQADTASVPPAGAATAASGGPAVAPVQAELALGHPVAVARVGAPAGSGAPLIAAAMARTEGDRSPKAGLRSVPDPARKAGRGKPGAKPGGQEQTHAQRNLKNLVIDNEGPLEDNLAPPPLPFTLHGISGIDDNGDTFLAEAQAVIARRQADPAWRAAIEAGEELSDASEGAA
jgi:hypothetical protein